MSAEKPSVISNTQATSYVWTVLYLIHSACQNFLSDTNVFIEIVPQIIHHKSTPFEQYKKGLILETVPLNVHWTSEDGY
jgi:hypothetical protein